MDSSSKNKVNGVPFQIITRNRRRVLSERPKEVKVVLKKLSPTQPSTSIIKSNMQAGPVEQMNTSPGVSKKRSLSPKSENLDQLNPLSVRSSAIQDIHLSNSTLPTEKDTSSSCIKPSLSDKKRKTKKIVPAVKTILRKSKQTVSGTINKKACKVSSVKVTAHKTIKDQLKSKTSQSTSAKVLKGSKNCPDCLVKEDKINHLRRKIRKLEEKEASMQSRLLIYEGIGLSHLQKEEEQKSLLNKRTALQMKLSKLEEELHTFLEREDEEIKSLLHKKITLKRDLTEKRKESEKLDAEEKLELKEISEEIEECKEMEAKYEIELAPLQEEHSALVKKIREHPAFKIKDWFRHYLSKGRDERIKEEKRMQEEKEERERKCEICIKLINEKNIYKKKLKEAEIELPPLRKELEELVLQTFDGHCDVEHFSLQVEYMKKRMKTQRDYNHEDESFQDRACYEDFWNRRVFTEKVCNMLDKRFHTKEYDLQPRSAAPLPKSRGELDMTERLAKEGQSVCCGYFTNEECRKYLCGRKPEGFKERTKEEEKEFELSMMFRGSYVLWPGNIKTEEGRQLYIEKAIIKQTFQHCLQNK